MNATEHAVPDAGEAPAAEAAVQRRPGAIPLRHVAPGDAGRELPENPVEDGAVVVVRPACPGLLGREQQREGRPLSVAKFMTSHTIILRPADRTLQTRPSPPELPGDPPPATVDDERRGATPAVDFARFEALSEVRRQIAALRLAIQQQHLLLETLGADWQGLEDRRAPLELRAYVDWQVLCGR